MIFWVEFDKISLADLVDDDRARERLHKADDLIESQNYEEALSEIAIALHIVLAQKYPRSPWASASDLLDTGPSSDRPPKIPYHSYGNALSGAGELIHKIEEGFEKLHDRISRQADVLEMLIWRIDLQEYSKFAQFSPYVSEMGDGSFYVVQRGGMRRPLTKRDAQFCSRFVLDSALSIQQQKHELPDLFAAQRLKTLAAGAKLYKVQDSSLVRCGEIPGYQFIDGIYACWSGEETVWQVEWQGVKGLVKNCDVVQLDNQ